MNYFDIMAKIIFFKDKTHLDAIMLEMKDLISEIKYFKIEDEDSLIGDIKRKRIISIDFKIESKDMYTAIENLKEIKKNISNIEEFEIKKVKKGHSLVNLNF